MVAHICYPAPWEVLGDGEEDQEFKVVFDYGETLKGT